MVCAKVYMIVKMSVLLLERTFPLSDRKEMESKANQQLNSLISDKRSTTECELVCLVAETTFMLKIQSKPSREVVLV